MDCCRALQRVRATPRAAWCALSCDPSRPATARQKLAAASGPPALVTCADNLQLSFRSVPETSSHRAVALDRGALLARSDDANRLLQLLADTLRALQTSDFG